MQRAVLTVTTVALALTVALDADAQRRRGRGQPEEPVVQEPTEPNPNIVALMNGLTWGMSRDEVVAQIKQEIKDTYWPRIQAAADDGVAEQRLRTQMERDQNAFEASCLKFEGQQTPWNVSMVDEEFTHNNQEEMCKFDRGDAAEFYFFIRGKLWKVFRALSSGAMAAAPPEMEEMRAQMETQFGPGEEIRKPNMYTMINELLGIRWIDSVTEMKLLWLDLYGVYAVVLTERATLGNLASLRRNVPAETGGSTGGITNAVTEGVSVDENADIVQRLRDGNRGSGTTPAPQPQRNAPTPLDNL